jgi:hypothetical protein
VDGNSHLSTLDALNIGKGEVIDLVLDPEAIKNASESNELYISFPDTSYPYYGGPDYGPPKLSNIKVLYDGKLEQGCTFQPGEVACPFDPGHVKDITFSFSWDDWAGGYAQLYVALGSTGAGPCQQCHVN